DHVIVGEDVAVRIDDEAGAHAAYAAPGLLAEVAEELLERIVLPERALHLGPALSLGADVHHRRLEFLGELHPLARLDRSRRALDRALRPERSSSAGAEAELRAQPDARDQRQAREGHGEPLRPMIPEDVLHVNAPPVRSRQTARSNWPVTR